MLETLHAPDEVWLNDEIKHDLLDTYCLLKYYNDEVLAVNYRIEGGKTGAEDLVCHADTHTGKPEGKP